MQSDMLIISRYIFHGVDILFPIAVYMYRFEFRTWPLLFIVSLIGLLRVAHPRFPSAYV